MGSYGTYDQLISTAKGLGWTPSTPNIWASVSAMGFGAWLFFGWIFPVYVGGEIKEASKNMLVGLVASILFLWFFWVLIGEMSWAVAGKDWTSAVNWLATNHPTNYPVPSYPWISFITPLLTDNPVLIWLMLIGYSAMWIANDLPKIMVTSRIIFSWSFDRVMPKFAANVSDRFHAPTWAVVITGTLAIVWLYIGVFTGIFSYYLNIAGLILIAYSIVSISAAAFPFRLKTIFEASPSFVKVRVGGIPLISILGSISAIIGVYATYYALTTPVMGPVSMSSYSTIAVIFILGLVVYEVAKYYRKKQGLDLELAFKVIPPE
jgi:amino acid transporter